MADAAAISCWLLTDRLMAEWGTKARGALYDVAYIERLNGRKGKGLKLAATIYMAT